MHTHTCAHPHQHAHMHTHTYIHLTYTSIYSHPNQISPVEYQLEQMVVHGNKNKIKRNCKLTLNSTWLQHCIKRKKLAAKKLKEETARKEREAKEKAKREGTYPQ